jgi:hypothetical protein
MNPRHGCGSRRNPFRVGISGASRPGVAPSSQPRALWRNPFGIRTAADGSDPNGVTPQIPRLRGTSLGKVPSRHQPQPGLRPFYPRSGSSLGAHPHPPERACAGSQGQQRPNIGPAQANLTFPGFRGSFCGWSRRHTRAPPTKIRVILLSTGSQRQDWKRLSNSERAFKSSKTAIRQFHHSRRVCVRSNLRGDHPSFGTPQSPQRAAAGKLN